MLLDYEWCRIQREKHFSLHISVVLFALGCILCAVGGFFLC